MTEDPKQPADTGRSRPITSARSRPITSARSSASLLGGAPHEQIAAAIADQQIARAVELLQQHGERMLVDGAAESLAGWLDALPDAQFQQSYRLSILAAWVAIYQQRFRDAATRLAQAERALQTKMIAYDSGSRLGNDFVTRPFAEAQQGVAAVKAHLAAVSGDEPGAVTSVDAMMLAASADHPIWRAEALVVLGRCRFLSGDAEAASRDLSDALALASASGASRARRAEADALVLLGHLARYAGSPSQAAAHFASVGEGQGWGSVAAGFGQADLALDALDLDAARRSLAAANQARYAQAADTQGDAPDPLMVTVAGATASALVHALSGQDKEALAIYEQLERDLKPSELRWLVELVQPIRTRLAILRQDAPLLKRHTQQATVAKGPARGLGEIRRQLALSAAHLFLDNLDVAQRLAEGARASVADKGLTRIAAEAELYAAIATAGLDSGTDADAHVLGALTKLGALGTLLPVAFVACAPVTARWLADGTQGAGKDALAKALAQCGQAREAYAATHGETIATGATGATGTTAAADGDPTDDAEVAMTAEPTAMSAPAQDEANDEA